MRLKNQKVALLVHNYFEQAEFEAPLAALEASGAEVTVMSTDALDLQALKHVDRGRTFTADKLIEEVTPGDFQALVLPGGVVNADKLRMSQVAREWVLEFMESGKLVAAICHAPWLLVSADVVEERRLTSYYTLQDDIKNAGGEWSDHAVVIDGNLITSRQPDDLGEFNDAIIEWLSTEKAVV